MAQDSTPSPLDGVAFNGATSGDPQPPTSRGAHVGEWIFYLPRERKFSVFRGNSGIGIVDWVEEVRSSMRG